MPRSVLRYVASLAVLIAAYGLYALAAVPFIEPDAKFRDQESEEELNGEVAEAAMRRQQEQLANLFQEGDWELRSPKVLAADQAKLLFQDYQPMPDGRIELKPCTLVFYAGGANGKAGRPIVMRAPAGAVLHFDRPLNLGQSDLGRLLGGRMLGDITISSGETEPGADDALEVITRNVQLDEEHIWTPHEVRFRYGQSVGSGRDLTIALTPKAKASGEKKGGLGASGIKTLELVHVDKLRLVTRRGGLLPEPAAGKPAAGDSPSGEEPLPVEVTCRGPFRFDFNRLVASFEELVEVRRLHPSGDADQLNCQLLELYFAKGDQRSAVEPSQSAGGQAALSGLEVQRLVAVGHPVILTSGPQGASAKGQRFEYDLRSRRILLEDGQKATLKHDKHYIESRGLAYELGESGRLGRLWAAGPGIFKTSVGTDGEQKFEASWAKELRLRPHQGSHVISLTREAAFGFSNQGGLRADEIHVWLREDETAAGTNAPRPNDPTAPPAVVPEKLLAIGKVEIDSPQLSGRAPRLEAWFKTDPQGAAPPERGAVNSRPLGNPFVPPNRGSADGGLVDVEPVGNPGQPSRPPQKFDISGNLIQIQMLRRGAQTEVENVTVDGQVRLVEVNPIGKEPPLDMQGDTLQLFEATSPRARARVTGRPAKVAARSMKLSGETIQLHRGENRLWIDGAGEMTLPAQRNALATPHAGPRVAPRGVPPVQTITVTWQHRMNFDGLTARFERQVEARGESQYAKGEALEITLNQRFDFSQPKAPAGLDVRRLAFDGGVFLENRTLEDQRVTSVERLQARKLSVDNQNGRLNAVGPGWVSSVRLGNAAGPIGPPGRGGGSSGKPRGEGLNYLHVDFQTAIAGNLVKREIQFLDRVTAVHGPITSWEQELSPDRLEDLPEQGVLLNCDRLTVTEMGQNQLQQKLYEMEAAGNTRVEGKTFTATADRMTYAQAKDLIVLEGDGRSDAELWRQTRVGGAAEHAAARKILFWQRENRAQVDDARYLDLSQFGSAPPRAAPRKP